MKKTITLLLAAILLIAAVFSGCASRSEPANPEQPGTTQATTPPAQTTQVVPPEPSLPGIVPTELTVPDIPTRLTKEEELAIGFVDALLQSDYGAALEKLSASVYPNALVFEEDLQWALPRTEYRALEYIDAEAVEYSTSVDNSGTVTVHMRDAQGGNETLTVRTEIPKDGDGTPRVNGNGDFYRVSYSFRTPSNVQVEINGVPIDKSYITKKNSGKISMYTDWTVPVIGVKDKLIRVYCDNFDATETFTPKSFSDPQNDSDCRFAPNYEDEDILLTVKELWNRMYAAASAKDAKPSDLHDFIAKDADPDTAQNIFDGYKEINQDYKSAKMTQAVFRTDGHTFWANDHCLVINFGYELTWDFYGSKDMKRLSHIILALEDGVWKVYRVTDGDLFSYTNYFTSEW